jgi:benzoyl-CoA reductase/2-hydroxyglutaryl-CoA dehydratase subunit BcrC/BadD/HgdB
MLKMLLETMSQFTESALKERTSFRALWYYRWADVFLEAFKFDCPVVYTSIYAFPMEILAAFDVAPMDFEIAGAMISSTEMGVPNMAEAEKRGYSQDVCSFHRSSLGAFFQNYLPDPELLITTSFYCDGKTKTNDLLSVILNKQACLLSVPQEINKDSIAYVKLQLRQIAGEIGRVAGQGLDEDRLKEVVRSSNRSRKLQLQVLDLLKHCPNPWNPQDLIGYSINGEMFNGTEIKEELNAALLQELSGRITSGKLRQEDYRLYWFGWPPTYNSNLFKVLKDNNVGVPLCENYRVFWDEIDEDDPFEGLALKCLKNPFIGPVDRRLDGMEEVIDTYNIDGALLFATPACKHANTTHMLIKDRMNELGIPFYMLDMDISDPRGYMPEQTKTRVESFVEVMNR